MANLFYLYNKNGNEIQSFDDATFLYLNISPVPVTKTSSLGEAVSFSAGFTDPFSLIGYQWFKNGVAINNATGDSLLLRNIAIDDEAEYTITVTYTTATRNEQKISKPAHLWIRSNNPLPKGCISSWRGDENANDIMGNNNGAMQNGVSTAQGKVGKAFLFTAAGQHVQIPASGSLDVGAGNDFTIELWINPSDVTNRQPLVEWNDGQGNFGMHLWISESYDGGGPGCLFANIVPRVIPDHFHSANNLIQANTWQHIALTYQKNEAYCVIYLNGVEVAAKAFPINAFTRVPETPDSANKNLYLGYRPNNGDKVTFSGLMDEVTIYNRALTSNEIQSIYNYGSKGKDFEQLYVKSGSQLPSAKKGLLYNFQVAVAFGTPPYAFSLVPGSILPPDESQQNLPNMILSQSGIISGTPKNAGLYHFYIRATDATGFYKEQLFSLEVKLN